ncbi:MAG: 23S rRNA (uracil(1939)-C(5))-methyltransferase RlmD [Candidatus Competibacterales bacterium]
MTRRRSRRPPKPPFETSVTDLAHDGRGVARRDDGKTVFVHGALPGERVVAAPLVSRSRHDEAEVETVLTPSPDRVVPRCPHFGVCGGCSLQHLAAERQIVYKERWLLDNLNRIGRVTPQEVLPPLTGPHFGYRHKARLAVKAVAKKGRVLVGFRERKAPLVADLRGCEVLHPAVGHHLPALAELVAGLSISQRLPQIEVAVGDDIAALNFRVLDPPTEAAREALQAFGEQHGFAIYLQPKGPDTVEPLGKAPPALHYLLPDFQLRLAFKPQHFTQVNFAINRQMVSRAVALLAPRREDRILDLFCGLGNFTLALARVAAQVVGVEGDADLVAWAQGNAAANGVTQAEFHSADLSLPQDRAPWAQARYGGALLDPPRSGALPLMPLIARRAVPRFVYVSCHPATLARDVGALVHDHGYTLRSAGVMDMFPHTAHVESMALLER